jgi:hypothetical protein
MRSACMIESGYRTTGTEVAIDPNHAYGGAIVDQYLMTKTL